MCMKNISDVHGVGLYQEFKSTLPVPTLFSLVFPRQGTKPRQVEMQNGHFLLDVSGTWRPYSHQWCYEDAFGL